MRQYVAPLIRWWWLILAATILAGISSFIAVMRQPPVYEVRTTLVIGSSFSNLNPNSSELYLEQQLATVYANLASREQVASATMKVLGLNGLPQYYVRTVPNTPLIEIIVSDTDPARAVAVANELANQLVLASPSGKEQKSQVQQGFISDQLTKIQDQIKSTEDEIAAAQDKLGGLNSARQIADTQTQITALQQKLISLQGNYANLLTSTQQGAVNTLALVQAAEMPTSPVGPNKIIYVILAAALGLMVSSGSAYGFEFLDNTYKTGDEVSDALKVPVLGYIPDMNKKTNQWTYSSHYPRSPVADAFRILRTNLDFISVDKPIKTLLVTGSDLSMGKSVIATNLALILSQSERKVILVDADLRRPKLSTVLKVDENRGISEVILGIAKLLDVLVPWHNLNDLMNQSKDLITETNRNNDKNDKQELENENHELPIRFMPAGSIPPNPADLLASSKFSKLLAELTEISDIVIMDSPPLFLPDASVLLGKVDGVILIVELGRTRKNAIKTAKNQIDRSGANLLGIVINRVSGKEANYEKYQSYGSDLKVKPFELTH